MNRDCQIGLIGDFSPTVRAHAAIPRALELAAALLGQPVRHTWAHTSSIGGDFEPLLGACDALWCVPGSPYASMDGALRAIRFARERPLPFLGTCGGFQHACIEYGRNVLGWTQADHAESNPSAALELISPLSCSMVGATGEIRLQPGSRISGIYGRAAVQEQYHCNYGLNPKFRNSIQAGGLRVGAVATDGGARAIELEGHPFFIATLFQPELSALQGGAHPLIVAFVAAALAQASRSRLATEVAAR